MAAFNVSKIADILAGEIATAKNDGERLKVRNIAYSLADAFVAASPKFDRRGFYEQCKLPALNGQHVDISLNTKGDKRIVVTPLPPNTAVPTTRAASRDEMVKNAAKNFAELLTLKFGGDSRPPKFTVEHGYKFDKVVIGYGKLGHDGASVHCFVDKSNGDVIKAASYKAPQRRADKSLAVMGNVSTDTGLKRLVKKADKHGSYLYTR